MKGKKLSGNSQRLDLSCLKIAISLAANQQALPEWVRWVVRR